MTLAAYLESSAAVIAAMATPELEQAMARAVEACVTALVGGRPLLICGNGGSAADAIHIAGELVGRFLKERRAYNVIALPANAAVLTAWSNDYGFDTVYARQVEAHGVAGGVLIAISTSGNSPNILAAAEAARAAGMATIALTGEGGGGLAALADVLLAVPSRHTPVIQQGHLCLYHHLCAEIEARLAES